MLARVYDFLNFTSNLSLPKIFNFLKLYFSYYRSKKKAINQHKGLPFSISIEPTTSCNLRCPECPSGLRSFTRPTGMLGLPLFKKVIEEIHPNLAYLILYFQGEPYLNPDFFELVRFASEKKVYTSTSTNAHYLTPENARKTIDSGLDRIIISIDGTSQDTYQSYRIGGSLEKVIEGTKNLIEQKRKLKSRTPYIIFQFLVVKPNEHQIPEVKKLAKELGVDEVKLKTAQIYDYENGSPLIPDNPIYSRYRKKEDGTFGIKNSLDNNCWRMWHSCVITWDGKVVPCCFDKDAQFTLGSLEHQSFKQIWESKTYNKFRSSLLKGRDQIEICKNCTEGTKVWA